jgi:hypothetical protein
MLFLRSVAVAYRIPESKIDANSMQVFHTARAGAKLLVLSMYVAVTVGAAT